jgi:DNA-binding MarR family transcriptional regulator
MPADPLDVCLRLVRVQAAVARRFDSELGPVHGISLGDLAILINLHGARGARMRRVDLAVRMLLSQSGVTRALAPLERMGLVAREADPRDARVGYATLTAAGRAKLRETRATAERISRETFALGWQSGEVDDLNHLLSRLGATGLPSPVAEQSG